MYRKILRFPHDGFFDICQIHKIEPILPSPPYFLVEGVFGPEGFMADELLTCCSFLGLEVDQVSNRKIRPFFILPS